MFSFLPQSLFTMHRGQRGKLSPRLWAPAVEHCMGPDGGYAVMAGSDFMCFGVGTATTSNVGTFADEGGAYRSYEDTGGSIAQIATEVGGVVNLATDATDNDEMSLQPGGTKSVLGKISDTAGADKLLIFETRFRISAVGDTKMNTFIGLMEETTAASNTIGDTGTIADKDYIGFYVAEGDGDELTFVYKKNGQTAQVPFTYGTAIAADTWYNVGFCYNPKAPPDKRIKLFIDNVEQTTYITATNIAAATFPDGEELNALWAIQSADGAIKTLGLDCWAFYQAG